MKIEHYDTATDLAHCFALMRELRSKLTNEKQFIAQVQRQQAQGYRLAGLEQDGKPMAQPVIGCSKILFTGNSVTSTIW